MFAWLIVLGLLLAAIGYALPDQYPAAGKREAGKDETRSNLLEDIARSLF